VNVWDDATIPGKSDQFDEAETGIEMIGNEREQLVNDIGSF
jgi:hypothetical protein